MTLTKLISAVTLGASLIAGFAPAAFANDTGAFLGGLAAGAIVGGAIAGGRPAPVYVAPAPVYGPPVYYQRRCWYEAQPVFNQFGYQVGTQTVQRCQ